MKKKLNERAFVSELVKIFRQHDCFVHKVAERFASGFPDLIIINPHGKVLFVEVKVGKNKLSPLQEHFLSKIQEHRGNAYVITKPAAGQMEVLEYDGLMMTYTLEEWLQKCVGVKG